MTGRRTQTDVPYKAAEMYDLVADVERYPDFLPWCVALRVMTRTAEAGAEALTADMIVAYKVFRERFRSRVRLDRARLAIDVDYMDGPFRTLTNAWRFADLPEGGSRVFFEIDFEFRNIVLQATARQVFDKAFSRMSDAFVMRAEEVYGRPGPLSPQ